MHFVRIGKKPDISIAYATAKYKFGKIEMSLKVYFAGSANNTPPVFAEEDAKERWKYFDHVAEKPV